MKKETLAQVFSCEFCEISKNTFFTEHRWATASALSIKLPLWHPGQNILGLCNNLVEVRFGTSRTVFDVWYKKHCLRVASWVTKRLKSHSLKGTLMPISLSSYENNMLKISHKDTLLFEICARERCEKLVYKHSETTEYVKN